MAERQNFYMSTHFSTTEKRVLDGVILDDCWDELPSVLSEAKARWPKAKLWKVTISVEEAQ